MVTQALSINMKPGMEKGQNLLINSKPPGPINIADGTINMAPLKSNKKTCEPNHELINMKIIYLLFLKPYE
jgi:hypothetical protein